MASSVAWDLFTLTEESIATCNICGSELTYHLASRGTSNFLTHARLKHPEEFRKALKEKSRQDTEQLNQNLDAETEVDTADEGAEADIHRLIEIVREAPILYDGNQYKHKESTDSNLWDEVARQMSRPGMTGSAWKETWQKLRRKYAEVWRSLTVNNMSPKALEGARQWKFFIPLRFLKPYVSAPVNHKESNHENNEDDNQVSGEIGDDMALKSERNRSTGTKRLRTSAAFQIRRNRQQMKASSNLDPLSHRLLVDISKNVETLKKTEENKTDMHHFFDVCMKRVEKLDRLMQSVLQVQILQLLVNAENPDMPPQAITPLPPRQSPVIVPKSGTSQVNSSLSSEYSSFIDGHDVEMPSDVQNSDVSSPGVRKLEVLNESEDEDGIE